MSGDTYVDPLSQRYASRAMRELFSPRRRAFAWRDLWIALAETQLEMGLPVSAEQVAQLREQRENLDLEAVAEHEQRLRHDVMAHIHHYGDLAPLARPILHLGATSCYVTDNADLCLYRDAMQMVEERLLRTIHTLADFAREHAEVPTLGLTHLQPAQLTTVGKRASLWLQDMVDVYEGLVQLRKSLPFRGVKGTTGTQASFLQLFAGDDDRVLELERRVAKKMGFSKVVPLSGQTYSRLWDYRILAPLGELSIALHKFSTDLRLLASWGEIEEPFQKDQIGSSAMPYKRNPMRSERLSSLSKLLLSYIPGVGNMAATQWMERTLDDSALRRAAMPQAFLAADAMLLIARNVCDGLVLHPLVAARRVSEQLPFMAAEEILMHGAASGGDRQDLHERIRQMSWQASKQLKEQGGQNPLRGFLEQDKLIGPILAELPSWDPARFIGRAPRQVYAYLDGVVCQLPQPSEDNLKDLSV